MSVLMYMHMSNVRLDGRATGVHADAYAVYNVWYLEVCNA